MVPENKVESLYPATSTGPEILCEYLEERVFTVSAPSPQPLPTSPPLESCSGTVLEHQVGTSPSMIWLNVFADITFFFLFALELSLTNSSVAEDLVGPTTALVRSELGWVLMLRMPGNQEVKPPLDAAGAGFFSPARLTLNDTLTLASLSGR